jgi:hypothetical protein
LSVQRQNFGIGRSDGAFPIMQLLAVIQPVRGRSETSAKSNLQVTRNVHGDRELVLANNASGFPAEQER